MDKRSDYVFDLPEGLIAQKPKDQRDASRLLVMDKNSGEVDHRGFFDLISYFKSGDVLVLNDTRVIPARLIGHRPSGGQVELLLLEDRDEITWECLAKPAKRMKVGERLLFDGEREAVILETGDEGRRLVRFEATDNNTPDHLFKEWLDRAGLIPLPPYIHREAGDEDKERYQTVYAKHDGAVAAPTAGLHFTDKMLAELEEKGVKVVRITLHVGIGTFRPVVVDKITDHKMDYERYTVSAESAKTINEAKKSGGHLFAVGTTCVRTIESIADESGVVHAGSGSTNIFLYPPYQFKAVDCLVTNFHLPGSTLIMLVSALAGRENIMEAYKNAVEEKYRFFSYGDAMLITDK